MRYRPQIGHEAIWNDRIAAVEKNGIEAIADNVLERWFSPAFHRDNAIALNGWRQMLIRTPVAGYIGTSYALRDTDYTDQVGSIAVPTLCIVGDQDGSTPPALVQELASLIPGARCEIINGAGHLPCIEQADRLVALIMDFAREKGLV